MSINPPPPRLAALGKVTARVNPTATAASIAFPPAFKISKPASVASLLSLVTIACLAITGWKIASEFSMGSETENLQGIDNRQNKNINLIIGFMIS